MNGIGVLAIAVAHVFVAAGCATAPPKALVLPAAAPGHQVLRIAALTWIESTPDFPGMARSYSVNPLPGVRCKARNAKGNWETRTPGFLEVAIGEGAGNLSIECELEGYRAEHKEFSCITPRARSATKGAMAGVQLFGLLGPAAVAAAPAAGAVVAALGGLATAGAAVGSATAGPDPDTCNYTDRGLIGVVMTRR